MSLQGFVMKIPIFIMNVMTNGPGGFEPVPASSFQTISNCQHKLAKDK